MMTTQWILPDEEEANKMKIIPPIKYSTNKIMALQRCISASQSAAKKLHTGANDAEKWSRHQLTFYSFVFWIKHFFPVCLLHLTLEYCKTKRVAFWVVFIFPAPHLPSSFQCFYFVVNFFFQLHTHSHDRRRTITWIDLRDFFSSFYCNNDSRYRRINSRN